MGTIGAGAQESSAGAAPTAGTTGTGMLATTPQNIPLQPQSPQTLGIDPSATDQTLQQLLGYQPLAVK